MSSGSLCVNCALTFGTSDERKSLVCHPSHFDAARNQIPKWVINYFQLNARDEFLDFGCGVLRIGLPIIGYLDCDRFYGYDLDPYRIEEAKLEVEEYNLGYKEPVLTADWNRIVQKRPFNNRLFKHIWCYQVLIHIPDDELDVTLGRIKDTLMKKGTALVSININTKENPTDGRWREYPFVCRSFEFYRQRFGKFEMNIEMVPDWEPEGGERILKVTHFQ